MSHLRFLPVALFFLSASFLCSQNIDLSISPAFNIPFGPAASDGSSLYGIGGGGSLSADLPLPGAEPFFARAQVGYDYLGIPTSVTPSSLSLISLGGGGGIAHNPIPALSLKASVCGGAGLCLVPEMLSDADPGNDFFVFPYVRAEGTMGWKIAQSVTVFAGAAYTHFLTIPTAYSGIGVTIGAAIRLGEQAARVKIRDVKLDPLFPVLYSSYDVRSFGHIELSNGESGPIEEVRAGFFVKEYMDTPMQMAVISEIPAGGSATIPLFAVFNDRLMGITEGAKLAAVIQVEYRHEKKSRTIHGASTLIVYDRNAVTWEDDRNAAAFVTAKSPAVLLFAKTVSGIARSAGLSAVNRSFRTGVAVFEALGLHGMRYVVDPSSSYRDKASQKTAVDYLQFPAQTLTYRAGDCDDLSILYAALLESVAVETAFITIPGHIYAAFSLDMSPADARFLFTNTQDLIFMDDNTWVPVEVTMMDRGFLHAWHAGAQQWREAVGKSQAGFFEVEKAWETYSPVGIEETQVQTPPREDELMRRYALALGTLVEREMGQKAAELERQASEQHDEPRLLNRLGVLYVRYGMSNKARSAFEKAIENNGGFAPTLNLANLCFIEGDYRNAARHYAMAVDRNPTDKNARIGLILAYRELGQDELLAQELERLKAIDAKAAESYAWLVTDGAGSRAASFDPVEAVTWSE